MSKNKGCVQVYTTSKMRIPAGGFHPFVGMHSVGEAVKLLQKEPWLPTKDEEVPTAFFFFFLINFFLNFF
jgi:hypothetical protein